MIEQHNKTPQLAEFFILYNSGNRMNSKKQQFAYSFLAIKLNTLFIRKTELNQKLIIHSQF